jgi:hypothetical protein
MRVPFDIPPYLLVPITGIIFGTTMSVILLYPIVRAWTRRMEQKDAPRMPADVSARLARIEAAVESIAIEVERISESQRFLTKLQADRPPLPSGGGPSDRPR